MSESKCSHYIPPEAPATHSIDGKCKSGFPVRAACYWDVRQLPWCMYDEYPKQFQWIGEAANTRARLITAEVIDE